jgi:membrane protein DedA with SNARE-associated domain
MIEEYLQQHGYVFIFAGSILEGDATLLAASFLAQRQHFFLPWVIAVASAATILFNQLIYALARNRGRRYLESKMASHKRYGRICEWVQSKSIGLLLVSRYIFGFRMAIPAACAMSGMRPMTFFVANVAGAIIWAVPVALIGFMVGEFLDVFWHELRRYEWHIAVALLAVIWTLLAIKDPELHRVGSLIMHTRAFALSSMARVRRRLAVPADTSCSGE